VPLIIVRHHEPIFALSNGKSASNLFLDEVLIDPRDKFVSHDRFFLDLSLNDSIDFALKPPTT
jgi:squalene-hopene/tetraprenyl-beta-curcumene cyclase